MENGNLQGVSDRELVEKSDPTSRDHRKTPVGDDPLEAVKRKVYLAALAVGLPDILLLWFTSGPANLFAQIAFPSFALFCLGCAWLIWSRTISIW